jgi:hypothetical protein
VSRVETLVSRVETPIKRGETSSSVGKRGGVPRRAGLSERGDAGRGGGVLGTAGSLLFYFHFKISIKSDSISIAIYRNRFSIFGVCGTS